MQKNIDLSIVVLLDKDSTMYLFFNSYFVEDKKIKGPLRVQSSGGKIYVNQKEKIPGYNKRV